MALNKTVLKADILLAFTTAFAKTTNPESAMEVFATQLSDAVDKFVKSGTVTTEVVTSGSPSSHTGTGTGTIS